MQLTRREFLEKIAAELVGASLILKNPELVVAASPQTRSEERITLEEVLNDKANKIGIREVYLNRLAIELFGDSAFQYVTAFKYDHEGMLKSEAYYNWMQKYTQDPRHHAFLRKGLDSDPEKLKEALDHFSRDKKFQDLPLMARTSRIIEYVNTQDGILEYATRMAYQMHKSVIGNSGYAAVFNNPYDFATHKKSTIFFDKKVFDEVLIELIGGKRISVPLSEEFIKDIVYHEAVHAKDIFHGINIEEGFSLTNGNIQSINGYVENLIIEGNAYQYMMEKTRVRRPKDNHGKKYNTAHILASVNLDNLFRETVKEMSAKEQSQESVDLFNAMSRKLRPGLEEANRVIMDTFYEALRKN